MRKRSGLFPTFFLRYLIQYRVIFLFSCGSLLWCITISEIFHLLIRTPSLQFSFCSKRGEIVKVHLGFNIGSEEGGLHYAVVIEKNNPKSSPVVTVVPLTSIKPSTNLERLHSGNVFLGNELFTSLNSKISSSSKHLQSELVLLNELIATAKECSETEISQITKKIEKLNSELELLARMRSEIFKMKTGSIALVNQITTISKIRIYDPKTDHDILSGVKLSNEKLDAIDKKIISTYTKG